VAWLSAKRPIRGPEQDVSPIADILLGEYDVFATGRDGEHHLRVRAAGGECVIDHDRSSRRRPLHGRYEVANVEPEVAPCLCGREAR
jgi:hypothetical protein